MNSIGAIPWWSWALAGAGFAALTTVLGKAGVAEAGGSLATAIRTVVVVVVAWLIAAGAGELGQIGRLSSRAWLVLSLSGLCTGLSWICYFLTLPKCGCGLMVAHEGSGNQ